MKSYPLEKQVCNLEISKRIRELGVTQVSLWYWYPDVPYVTWQLLHKDRLKEINVNEIPYSAFTVSELGELLPSIVQTNKTKLDFWYCSKEIREGEYFGKNGDTEANAKGLMLIYLLENNLIGKIKREK